MYAFMHVCNHLSVFCFGMPNSWDAHTVNRIRAESVKWTLKLRLDYYEMHAFHLCGHIDAEAIIVPTCMWCSIERTSTSSSSEPIDGDYSDIVEWPVVPTMCVSVCVTSFAHFTYTQMIRCFLSPIQRSIFFFLFLLRVEF